MSDPKDARMDAIRAKYQADPNYNPMNDPEAAELMESIIPSDMKDFPNAIERVRVAFADAASAVDDIDEAAAKFPNRKDLISSPQSKMFSDLMSGVETKSDDDDEEQGEVSEEEMDELIKKLQEEYPDIPFE